MAWSTQAVYITITILLLSEVYEVVLLDEKTDNYFESEALDDGYPPECRFSDSTMVCDGIIPQSTPNMTTDLYLSQIPPSHLRAGIFCNVSWENVRKLEISYNSTENGTWPKFLCNDAFFCLNQTKICSLHIDISLLSGFQSARFHGLENIKELDFSGCVRMENNELEKILTQNTNFEKLSKLRLSEVGNMQRGLHLTQVSFNGLAQRNVSFIDISSTETTVPETINFTDICETLTELNVSYTKFTKDTKFRVSRPCESLRVIEASGIDLQRLKHLPNMPLTFPHLNFILREDNCPQSLVNLRKVIANRVAAFQRKTSVCFLNCTLTIECEMPFPFIEEIQAKEYNLPCLDIKLKAKTNLTNHLKYLDVSNNGIRIVNPHILDILDHLKVLDVSGNDLGQMPHFDETFSALFQKNVKLTEIRLSGNELGNLPWTTFQTNAKLTELHLSNNNIRQVTFDISKLKQLRMIDLRNNSIEYLDESSIDVLETLYNDQVLNENTKSKNSTFAIDLRDNPFICGCKALHFLQWFTTSPLFENKRHEYRCRLNDDEIPMTDEAVKVAMDDCEKPIRRRRQILLSTLIPFFTLMFMAFTIVITVKKVKKRNYYKRLDDVIDKIHDDWDETRFPVFLSYSSEDSIFVTQYVLAPLQEQLQMMTDTDRDLVCIGDRYFRLGRSIFGEILQALNDCAVVVVVMSTNYIRSEYCKLEIEHARLKNKPIVILMKEEVNLDNMNAVTKEIFKHFTRIGFLYDEDGQPRPERSWGRICEEIIMLT